ncbi:alpha/beta-hydrolase [Tothia fuscella]|uniref:Alpha/beta-hydrolase n=1 Tax=Tothia fuscella TaxID=1048955 RepID=A0A9P4NG34_9PEZI|nr:alpha/beta-hydrolase [Tothia fuscella]
MATNNSSNTQDRGHDPVEHFTLNDGRTLAYARYGAKLKSERKSVPIFYFNGTPGSHLEANLIGQPACKLGIPVISTDRPGFGSSTWQDNRTLLDWPHDIIQLADHLQIPQFGIIALSGGGPYALACLHALPKDRLLGVVLVSSMYPTSTGTTCMLWQIRMLFSLAIWSTWLLEKVFDVMLGSTFRSSSHEQLVGIMEKQAAAQPLPEADKAVMKEVLGDETLSRGYLGKFWLIASEWGFRLTELDGGRLTIWHGRKDINVPVSMPDKASELIVGTEYKRLDDEAHVSLIVRQKEKILSNLVEKLKA